MKSIRPLFRPNGRIGTAQCHDAFQQWIGDPLRGRHTAPLEVRRGTLRTELVKRPDGHGYQLVGRSIQKFASVPGIIARARQRTRLLDREAEFLRRLLIRTIKKETYREWLSSSGLAGFFYEPDWKDIDNHRKYALYAMACFVDFFRRGQLDWQTPNSNDMNLVAAFLRAFADSRSAGEQRNLLQKLFDLEDKLSGVTVGATNDLSRGDRGLLLECRRLRLRAKNRAQWLEDHGFKGFGKSPLSKFRENPDSMRAQINTWTREILEK
jgi:hypothetical protein